MRKRLSLTAVVSLYLFGIVLAQEQQVIQLPKPDMQGGKPLMEVLSRRRTVRQYREDDISIQDLSNLLWAAYGVNDSVSQKRTAPSAYNWQEMDLYICMKAGVFQYHAKRHVLISVLEQDVRKQTTIQANLAKAPLQILLVADFQKMPLTQYTRHVNDEKRWMLCSMDAGFISQNIYLYCASAGLATVIRDWIPREELHAVFPLSEYQKVLLAQTVGHQK